MRFKVSLLQPNNSLILPNNHYVTNFYYNVPQDHYYSHKLSTFLFHLIATNSFFQNIEKAKTSFNFTPIIPLPTTEYDTIFTCMKNFQDVLQQRHLNYGPFWCDEGVYRTAKELKPLNPSLFANIFIGLGGFHTEKNLNILLWQLPPRAWNWKCVCWEWNIWSRSCSVSFVWRALSTWQKRYDDLDEALQKLQFQNYLHSNPDYLQDSQYTEALQIMFTSTTPNESAKWKYHEVTMKDLIDTIGDFNSVSCQKKQSVQVLVCFS